MLRLNNKIWEMAANGREIMNKWPPRKTPFSPHVNDLAFSGFRKRGKRPIIFKVSLFHREKRSVCLETKVAIINQLISSLPDY